MENLIPESLQPVLAEIKTYWRELPKMLAEGKEGQFALIKEDKVLSFFDTFAAAYQDGRKQFGFDPFLAQPVKSSDLAASTMKTIREELALYITGDQSLSDFCDWFFRETWNVHQWASPQVREMVYAIRLILDEHTSVAFSED